MKHRMFTVYDTKAKAYLPPFFLHREEMATRSFKDCVNSATHQFGKHPEDYTLYCVGTFDDDKGSFDTTIPVLMHSGLSLVDVQKDEKQIDFIDPAHENIQKQIQEVS